MLRQNHWQFHHHRGPHIVENVIDDFQLTIDWIDTTTAQTLPFKAHVSGTLQRSDLPVDATISFPKPLRLVWIWPRSPTRSRTSSRTSFPANGMPSGKSVLCRNKKIVMVTPSHVLSGLHWQIQRNTS